MNHWRRSTDQMERIEAIYADERPIAGFFPAQVRVVEDGDTALALDEYGTVWATGAPWAAHSVAARINNHFAAPGYEYEGGGIRYWKVRVGE